MSSTAPPNVTAESEVAAPQCPLCDYDLRGLVEPRCPECGFQFTWEELNDPARRAHPYLFEHHPERSGWSFRMTLLGGFRPAKFWRTLFPTQPSRPRRLMLYWAIGALLWFVLVAGQLARSIAALDNRAAANQVAAAATMKRYSPAIQAGILKSYGTPQAWAAAAYPRWPHWRYLLEAPFMRAMRTMLFAAGLWLLWPWLTMAGLMVFQASMRRARVRPIHVLRCVIYTGDLALWAALLMLVVKFGELSRNGLIGSVWDDGMADTVLTFSAVLMAVATYRLAMAYRHYLRFDHAIATAVVVQVMVALVAVKFIFDWLGYA